MIPKIDVQDFKRANVVYHEIKRRIIELAYAPGDKLSEVRIAEELGVGRSPIRTALSRLQSEGWVEVLPQSGTFVKGLSTTEVAEIFEMRLILESHLAGLAAERISDDELRRLRLAFSAFGSRVGKNRAEEFLELDLMFHTAIYDAAGNRFIKRILIDLVDKVRWIRRTGERSVPRFEDALGEIKAIYKAIVARDSKAAAAAMHSHLENASKYRRRK
jgi:DNA-binding GntR family transcriptional regulator